ncbi:hypothetical protein [Acinetobacter junii]|uniref:Lipoprotein n=1 Tax=Acinetobacter junii CIP 107470 = MTCC 11364 TaxID=1217666 RepID=S7WE75_ACIJU|nr:hypothetical protein [Acinetobacter junii]ENV50336.1 hypothetical protein F953_02250 [Acinetobacter junii CIP 107470 = MTCC 11364]EPR81435.1 hypothetical protein L292_1137 [Acinetobacter junii CIP 107470 = MTCC 11364]MDH1915525.1 hypothetical protein [Acinetobacter junii]
MNFIPSIFLSSVLLLTLTACNSGNDAPKTKDAQTQTSENSTADASETPPQSEDDFPAVDKSFLEDESYNAEEVAEPTVQEQFEVRVRREESQYSMTGYSDLLNIMSLNDAPTTITGVLINRGNCRSKGTYDYQNMRYGSVAKIYLGCSAEYVREVTITTNSGLTYTYNF